MTRQSDNNRKRTNGTWIEHHIFPRNLPKTLDETAENWLTEIKLYKKYSTYVKYSSIYHQHIKPYLGTQKLKNIQTKDYLWLMEQAWHKADKAGKTLSKSTADSIRTVFTQIMEFGNYPIIISPKSYNIPVSHNTFVNPVTVFTKDEQHKLQHFLLTDMDSYKLGLYVCMFTGLRLGEICALKIAHIDLSNRVISIRQTVQRIKSDKPEFKTELLVTKPKTENSVRNIPICDLLLEILKKYMPLTVYLVNGDKIMEPRTYQYFFTE